MVCRYRYGLTLEAIVEVNKSEVCGCLGEVIEGLRWIRWIRSLLRHWFCEVPVTRVTAAAGSAPCAVALGDSDPAKHHVDAF